MSNENEQPVSGLDSPPDLGTDPDWLTDTEQLAWRSFVDGSHRLLAGLDAAMTADSGLSFDEYRILVILSENETRRMSDLADGGLASRSTVSRQVSRLVEHGDVERLPDVSDARNRLVRISDAGRARLHEAAKDHVRLVRRLLFDHMTPEQVDVLAEVFTGVQKSVEHAGIADLRRLS